MTRTYAIIRVLGPDAVTWTRVIQSHETARRSLDGERCVVSWLGDQPWLPSGAVVYDDVEELRAVLAGPEWSTPVDDLS